jgi:uncharacterized protein (TIGR02466 family)
MMISSGNFGIPVYKATLFEDNASRNCLNEQIISFASSLYDEQRDITNIDWNYDCGIWTTCHIHGNIFQYSDVSLNVLRMEIEKHIIKFAHALNIKDYTDSMSVNFDGSWINILSPGQFQEYHNHVSPSCQFSGVYYVKVPDSTSKLVFRHPLDNLMIYWAQSDWLKSLTSPQGVIVSDGDVILFPSWSEHMVKKNESDSTRISIAFNFTITY